MELNDLTNTSGEWLRGTGPEADIVISSRIRLARNLAEFPFISRASEQDRAEIERILRDRVLKIRESSGELSYVNVSELDRIDRQFLVERQLISREHAEAKGPAAWPSTARANQPDDQRGGSSAHPVHAQRARPASRLGADQPDRRPDPNR